MIVTHSILQILDLKSGSHSFSETELDLSSDTTIDYILKIYNNTISSASRRKGKFTNDSTFKENLLKYKKTEITFLEFVSIVTKDLNDILSQVSDSPSVDLLIGEFREGSSTFFAIVILENKEGITHLVENHDGKISNLVVKSFSGLPQSAIQVNTYAIINIDTLEIYSQEKKRLINNEKHFILEEYLHASYEMSNSEQFKIIKNVTAKVCEEHGVNPCIAMAQVKNFLIDTPVIENMKPEAISEVIFKDKPQATADFNAKMHSKGINENINLDRSFTLKKAENHSIKTDSGIEITFPSDTLLDNEHLEFIDEADGTISIRLKNITKIINR